jgi:hypothetical protein
MVIRIVDRVTQELSHLFALPDKLLLFFPE